MAKKNYYCVWVGRTPGVYSTWEGAEAQVKGFSGAKFKGFYYKEDAETALGEPWEKYLPESTIPLNKPRKTFPKLERR